MGSIPTVAGGLQLNDIATGPTSDTVVAAHAGSDTFEQVRWNSRGTLLGTHQDQNTHSGPMYTSNLFVDPTNGAFYGILYTDTGTSGTATLITNRLAEDGSSASGWPAGPQSGNITGAAPSVTYFAAGGDSGGGLHAPMLLSQYMSAGVYCYGGGGSWSGISASEAVAELIAGDLVWVTGANDLAFLRPVTASLNLGCGEVTVPTGGGYVLALLTGGCGWNKLLQIPPGSVTGHNFKLGADGSMLMSIVYSGQVNFGKGALNSTGTSSLAVARFDGSGNIQWANSYGGSDGAFTIGTIGGDAQGNVVISAGYSGSVDLGTETLPASDDTLIAEINSSGDLKWVRTVSVGSGHLRATAASCGAVVATDSPSVNLGGGPLTSANGIGVAGLGL